MATEEVGLRLTLQGRREAAAGLTEVRGELENVADAGHDVEDAGKAAERGLERASDRRFARGFSAIGRGIGGVSRTIGRGLLGAARVGAVALGTTAVAAGALSVKAISLASDARETASAFDTVFGPAAQGIERDLEGLTKRFGLYGPELQDATRQLGVFGKAAGVARADLPGFATDLTRAGLDLSSFYNVSSADAFAAIQSGLSGEAEPLRRFGIFLSDAAMKAQAAQMGLTGELTEQQKVLIRQKLILKGLGDAQGDLARTSDGFANQQRGATGRIKSLLTTIGGPLTTAATGAFRGLNAVLKVAMRELEQRMPGLEKGAGGLSGTFERWGKSMAKGLPDALDRIAGAGKRVSGFFSSAREFTDGIDWGNTSGGLSAIGTTLASADWGVLADGFGSGVSDTVSVFNVVIGFAADHIDDLAAALPYLIVGFAAYKTAQAAANVAALAHLPILAANVAANLALAGANRSLATQMAITNGVEKTTMLTRARSTAATIAHGAATVVTATATKIAAAGQWLLNAALTANPIGLVVAGIALLVGGLILAYKKSETFRSGVDFLWNSILKPFGKFVGTVLVGYFKLLANAWLMMGRFGIKAFTWLLKAAFATFDGILSAAEKGLGWVPGLGDKIKGAREAFGRFGDATIGKLNALDGKLKGVQDRVNGLAKDRSATITITTVRRETAENSLAGTGMGPQLRAHGGPVTAGRPYIVGERRPELFVPNVSGMILPRVPAAMDSDFGPEAAALTASGGRGEPTVIQVVLPNGKVLAETMIEGLQAKKARA